MAAQCVTFDTELGVIEMEMFPEHAPESVRNFLNLTATGLFDTTVFGRVVPGFVIQGGDLYSPTQGHLRDRDACPPEFCRMNQIRFLARTQHPLNGPWR